MSTLRSSASRTHEQKARRAVTATVIGNGLEWFDFTVYSFFSVIIAKVFFPTGSELTSYLLALATFGVGFFMRPVGGIVLGIYSDKRGRKAALSLTILLMALGTLIIGLTPSFAQIGYLAPLLIVLARLLQGFSAGGEMGSATAFLTEHAPEGKKSLLLQLDSGQHRRCSAARLCAGCHSVQLPYPGAAGKLGLEGAISDWHTDRAGRLLYSQPGG
ncbi:Permease of the major facilitator superfamily [Pseudomonas syringae pv. broussonetiae]|uniref:Permease of the major facilitator superfamily n=1 Tax=Pseudomonas savastanoi TaxID=29438 RepID=A0A3M5JD38_PSESS|nr:Permease of the major facilitator superfamily [Pseudomonas syringae pv. broussonetiae]RMS28899.1 Permease of the major facilitator superfamily [Pseudomonas savastanoi]RMT21043.1 Permease of the major facilitator superfamily [Pseudomonas savastanoi]